MTILRYGTVPPKHGDFIFHVKQTFLAFSRFGYGERFYPDAMTSIIVIRHTNSHPILTSSRNVEKAKRRLNRRLNQSGCGRMAGWLAGGFANEGRNEWNGRWMEWNGFGSVNETNNRFPRIHTYPKRAGKRLWLHGLIRLFVCSSTHRDCVVIGERSTYWFDSSSGKVVGSGGSRCIDAELRKFSIDDVYEFPYS
jgi:hypothetical protein